MARASPSVSVIDGAPSNTCPCERSSKYGPADVYSLVAHRLPFSQGHPPDGGGLDCWTQSREQMYGQ